MGALTLPSSRVSKAHSELYRSWTPLAFLKEAGALKRSQHLRGRPAMFALGWACL